ncbi:hypothetical protein T02_15091 [Trichinella nativa]|uniref:Uncharacterized protein n=1 Tax=Trichinella nativa TaxID=6335 RepID=A0A0V1L783_9BILA|nr:hypothetical protein T06_5823 [Trichinella sp. T6]KRZ55286.1 hypothetical protein T02_15091 [Trichinella nativa]
MYNSPDRIDYAHSCYCCHNICTFKNLDHIVAIYDGFFYSDLFSVEMCAYFFLVLFNVYFAFEALTIPNSSLESFALHGQ